MVQLTIEKFADVVWNTEQIMRSVHRANNNEYENY